MSKFGGQIPSHTYNSSSHVKFLDFSFNEFIGQIPDVLRGCFKLEVFRAGFNFLTGLLPSDIYNTTTLTEISLPGNYLSGPLGDELVQLSNLTIFEHYSNELDGEIPQDIEKLSRLERLPLHSNKLTGDILAVDFSRLQQLSTLDLGNKSLRVVRLDVNELEGQIVPEMAAMQSLSFLTLSANRLINITGAIRILIVILSQNFMYEAMPDGKSIMDSDGFQKLQLLHLGGCQLSGRMPSWLIKFKTLKVLEFSFNQLTGSIPSCLGSPPRLFYLDLAYNLFSSEFPQELCRLSALISSHYEKQQPKFGLTNIPPTIRLRKNSLSGNIPLQIGQLKFLHVLDQSQNNFSGSIPGQISNLTIITKLDLSENHLSGEIPMSLQNLYFLSSFSVANNNIQGHTIEGSTCYL
ncbi:receptor-like protein 3 [Camellia sinensis]|uniref:receptor-like protein 3 n=1 Tax=Camellia sinensis TaxID=4442 RepID=UPI00103685AE|nr:receptor-like protein 3 [Camellia sinensis]